MKTCLSILIHASHEGPADLSFIFEESGLDRLGTQELVCGDKVLQRYKSRRTGANYGDTHSSDDVSSRKAILVIHAEQGQAREEGMGSLDEQGG